MKKNLIIVGVFSLFVSLEASAQLKVHSNGNVSIQTSEIPSAALVVGGINDEGEKVYFESKNKVLTVKRVGPTSQSGSVLSALEGSNVVDGTKFYFGTRGYVYPLTNNPINMGRAFGVYGEAGNSSSGYNYPVFGNLRGLQNGASIVGTLDVLDVVIPGRYAGYFMGDVRVTGNFYGTMLTPSASNSAPMGRTAVMPLSTEAEGNGNSSVSDKLLQLKAIQYHLSEPQLARTFSAGDTTATAPRLTTDLQALEKTHYGLDAEVLKEVYPNLVYESQEGDLCINYTEMIPILVEAINELQAKVTALQGEKARLLEGKATEENHTGNVLTLPALEQNEPNPFSRSTVIEYTLPQSVHTAFLYIYDLNGTQIDRKTLANRGKSSVTLETGSLTAGMYLYALVADGKVIDTKRMIITR